MKKTAFFFTLFFIISSYAQTGSQSTLTLDHNGQTREYILYVPQMYDGQVEVPLVLNLHGLGSNMVEQLYYGAFRKIADTANFILVVPNGTIGGNNNRYWNLYSPTGADDIGFLTQLIDELSNQYVIDADRIYSTGMSNGGFMSYYLACNLSNKITAIASVTGTMNSNAIGNCIPSKPVPTMLIHGTDDSVVPYNGTASFASVPAVLAHWVSVTNCNSTPFITSVPDIDQTDGCTAEHYVYSGGTNGATVEHYKIIGGEHTWPGAAFNVGITNQDFDASTEIWRFFRQFNSSVLLNNKSESQLENLVNIYPNPSYGTINIDINQAIDKLEIITAQGQIISTENNVEESLTFTNIKPGIYFIKIHSKGKMVTKKLIVR
jgi:polyhydroxybutyrate depolymerase